MNRHLRLGLAALCTFSVLAAVAAQTTAPTVEQQAEEAVKFRQADMDMQAYSLAPVLPMLQGASFDAATVQKAAARLTIMMEMLADVFRTDTSDFPIKTKARATIWTDPLAFESKVLDMQAAVQKLTAAAKGDDSKATLQAARDAVGACRACHEKFGNGLN
jgi:cytochrome c556